MDETGGRLAEYPGRTADRVGSGGSGLAGTARRLRALPPSCGPVRLVALDGHAGAGKTTFAGRLAPLLDDAPVVRLDDLATHEELFDWVGRVLDQVVRPLAEGVPARYRAYDWVARRFDAPRVVEPAAVVLLEGVGAGRRALRPWLASTLWMDLAPEVAHARGRRRDGAALSAFWRRWEQAERAHFAADPSRPWADALVREVPDGYRVWARVPNPRAHDLVDHPE